MAGMKKVFLAASLALVSGATWAQGISVTVNGNPVAFPKQGPIQAPDGSILVPLREVFESLGASVQFLPKTRTITGSKRIRSNRRGVAGSGHEGKCDG